MSLTELFKEKKADELKEYEKNMSRMVLFNGATAEELKEFNSKNNSISPLLQKRQQGIEKIENICNNYGWGKIRTGGTFHFNYSANAKDIEHEIFQVIVEHQLIPVAQL
ncbi:hypothetical protein [Bacillus bombysepticus]|uniref:hypothetical protein n=1 Tax=Bacillus bombysepticus TaxID=658666 RepID=UPI00301B170F